MIIITKSRTTLCISRSCQTLKGKSHLPFLVKGSKASAGGGRVRRWCGRGLCHWCWHHRGWGHCLSFFLFCRIEGGAHQWANRLQAASKTCHTADIVWKFTVLIKSFVSVIIFFPCQNVKCFYDVWVWIFLYSFSKADLNASLDVHWADWMVRNDRASNRAITPVLYSNATTETNTEMKWCHSSSLSVHTIYYHSKCYDSIFFYRV